MSVAAHHVARNSVIALALVLGKGTLTRAGSLAILPVFRHGCLTGPDK